jgi:cobaltochelatase CobS
MADIANVKPDSRATTLMDAPDKIVKIRDLFGVDSDMEVPASPKPTKGCRTSTHLRLRSGRHPRNMRGLREKPPRHGARLSRHRQVDAYRAGGGAPQLAAHPHQPRRPYQPHRSGRPDAIVLREGQQVTEFREGLLPWALQTPTALVFDEYDAGPAGRDVRDPARAGDRGQADPARPEPGDPPEPLVPPVRDHQHGGTGDTTGLYHGTQQINQGQMDRWNIVVTLNYLRPRPKRGSSSPSRASTTMKAAARKSSA